MATARGIGSGIVGGGGQGAGRPRPDRPVAVIGDVHGCDALLGRLLDRLDRDEPGRLVVLVGDLVDRGEHGAAVLRRLMGRPDLVTLAGNHESMLLETLDDPARAGVAWLRNGGLQTLASYGVGGLGAAPSAEALAEAGLRLREAMGEAAVAWLRDRPLWALSGNLLVAHAGADPDRPPEAQPREALLWGHPRFGRRARADGLWVAFGHRIQPQPYAEGGVIATDTGAFATGRLTAALVDPDGAVRFLEA